MREICTSGSMSGMWKRSHGLTLGDGVSERVSERGDNSEVTA